MIKALITADRLIELSKSWASNDVVIRKLGLFDKTNFSAMILLCSDLCGSALEASKKGSR